MVGILSSLKKMDNYYKKWITEISKRFKNSQLKAAVKVNDEMLRFYWSVGQDYDKAIFYVQKTLENNWSRAVLLNFLDTNLYERQGKAIANFSQTIPAVESDLAQEITKEPYNFDFLAIREKYDEEELKDTLMDNLTKFLLELGNGFAFVGREVRLEIGETENFIDMLFYNRNLHGGL